MLKLENVSPQEMPEVVRIASELYEKDQEKEGEAQEREATLNAAEEVGLPPEYLHRAAAEMHNRRVVEIEERRLKRRRLLAATAAVLGIGSVIWGVNYISAPAPAPSPAVYTFSAAENWTGQVNEGTQAKVVVNEGKLTIQVEKFVPDAKGTYFANADTYQIPPNLARYETVRFRVRGEGLPNVRLYLENGPTERWRSQPVTVAPSAQEVILPLDKFERLTRPDASAPFQRQAYRKPDSLERLSFKTGDFVNDANAKGEIIIDNVTFE